MDGLLGLLDGWIAGCERIWTCVEFQRCESVSQVSLSKSDGRLTMLMVREVTSRSTSRLLEYSLLEYSIRLVIFKD